MEQFPNQPLPKETWEARKPFILGREYFELQMEFAKEIQRKTGKPLLDIIKDRTSEIRLNAYELDWYKMLGLKPGITEGNILDMSYAEYLKTAQEEPIEYHLEGGSRFGCFSYDQSDEESKKDKNKDTVRIHFFNAEFDSIGPLDKSKIELRKKEIRGVLGDIKMKLPGVKEVTGLSWLYNLPSYKRLFPQSYLDSLEIEKDPIQWRRGTTIWGQFMDNQYHLKKDLAGELLRRIKALPADKEVSEVFKEGPPLLPPLKAHGPIEDFYKMYEV